MKIHNVPIALFLFTIIGCAADNISVLRNDSKIQTAINYDKIINRPSQEVVVKPQLLYVDAEKDSIYTLEKGGYVNVKAHSFVHINGDPVTGKVEISVEVYKSLAEIILSGIPMKYDSAGVEYDFTSAGMYSISGKQNEKNVVIAPNKALEVGISSNTEDSPCFNFYELKENGDWNYISTELAVINPDIPNDLQIPEKPVLLDEEDIVFDLNIQKISKIDNSELEYFLWQYDGLRKDTVDKDFLSGINYKNLKLEKTEKSQWSYNLQLKDKNKLVNIPVKPVFTEDNIEEALKEYEKALSIIQANSIASQAIEEGRFLRVSKILNFGVYNFDKVIKDESRKVVAASFDFGRTYSSDYIAVYHINKDQNAVICYNRYTFHVFSFNPLHRNVLVAILPNHEVAILNAETFNFQTRDNSLQNIHFKLNLQDKLVTTSKELDELIKSI